MNIVAVFTRRPVATTLLAIGLALAGFGALFLLPVAPLPNIDLPTIVVSATMAGRQPGSDVQHRGDARWNGIWAGSSMSRK